MKLQARLPQDKFDCIAALLESWSLKQYCTRKELESLIGNLQHACKVIPQGRTFLQRMINLLSAFRRDDHPIRLNQDFPLDLSWWHEFFHSWDGFSFLLSPEWAPLPEFHVSSDAAGALGYGAIFDNEWFVGEWSPTQKPLSIAYKELFPVSCFQWLSHPTYGATVGLRNAWSFVLTIWRWSACYVRAPRRIQT